MKFAHFLDSKSSVIHVFVFSLCSVLLLCFPFILLHIFLLSISSHLSLKYFPPTTFPVSHALFHVQPPLTPAVTRPLGASIPPFVSSFKMFFVLLPSILSVRLPFIYLYISLATHFAPFFFLFFALLYCTNPSL